MPKLIIKSKTIIILGALTLLASISLFVNSLLFLQKGSIEKKMSQYLTTPIRIGNIFYLPPNYFILKNISIFESNSLNKTPMLKSTSMLIKFSFLKIFTKRQLAIRNISINEAKVNKSDISLIFKEFIILQANQPFKNRLKINIQNAGIVSNMQINSEELLKTNIKINLDQNKIFAQGEITTSLQSKNSFPLNFDFNARQTSTGTFIENIKLTHKNINTNVWGTFQKSKLQLKGYSLINFSKNEENPLKKINTDSLLSRIIKKNKPTGLPSVDIFLLDLKTDLTLTPHKININNLSFKLNDTPISTTGYIRLNSTNDFYLKSKIVQKHSDTSKPFSFKKIEIENLGSLNNNLLFLNNKTRISFPSSTLHSRSATEVEISLKDLQANILPLHSFRTIIQNTQIDVKANKKKYSTNMNQLRFRTQLSKNNSYNIEFQTSLYNGFARGTLQLPKNLNLKEASALVEFNNIKTQSIYTATNSFPNIKGKLSGKVRTTLTPSLQFDGNASITNGTIYDNAFFGWIANYFDLPELEEVNFKSLSLKFSGTSKSAEFDNIFLKSNKFGIKGHFYINENRFVNSQVSLLFQRDFLKQSKKLKRLTKLVAQDINPLDFNFKLSGNIETVNFQWLYSDFKKSLEEQIPKRYQKKIEESIEEIITSNTKAQTDMAQLHNKNQNPHKPSEKKERLPN